MKCGVFVIFIAWNKGWIVLVVKSGGESMISVSAYNGVGLDVMVGVQMYLDIFYV